MGSECGGSTKAADKRNKCQRRDYATTRPSLVPSVLNLPKEPLCGRLALQSDLGDFNERSIVAIIISLSYAQTNKYE